MVRHRPNPVVVTVAMVAIAISLAAVLYVQVGGCYYTGARAALTWEHADVPFSQFVSTIATWSRTTETSYNETQSTWIYFGFACDSRSGHGSANLRTPSGGANATAQVSMSIRADRSLPSDDPGVAERYRGDLARLEPCVQELAAALSTAIGRAPDAVSWGRAGIC